MDRHGWGRTWRAWSRRVAVGVMMGVLGQAGATDWAQFLGPHRNGTTPDAVGVSWGADGPVRRWRLEVGAGFSGPVVSGGRAFLLHQRGTEDVLTAVDAQSGAPVWEQRQATSFEDAMGSGEGPRGTPCVAGGRVVCLAADGRLGCFQAADGRRLWSVDVREVFHADPGFFGFGCSPLVVGNQVLVNVGGRPGAGLVALEADTGRTLWKLKDQEAGYASPVAVPGEAAGAGLAVFFNREGLVGVSLPAGTEAFSFPWRSRMSASVNAASPVVLGNEIFLTASYGTGAVLLRRRGVKLETVWSGDDSLSAHFATPVVRDGFLYGFHGRQEGGAELRCVEWSTGKVRWKQEGLGAGSVALAADRLVILLETGELVVARAQPDAFAPLARAQVLGRVARAPFALADGVLHARDSRQWVAISLKPTSP